MGYSRAKKTEEGNELLGKLIAGETTITFTKIATSEKPIEEFEVKQEMIVSATKFTRDTKVGVLLNAIFSNVSLVEEYDINVIAVFAKDGDNNEIMFSYLEADDKPTTMEAYNGETPYNVNVNIEAGLWLDDGSVIIIDPSGPATKEYVDEQIDIVETQITNLKTDIQIVATYVENGITKTERYDKKETLVIPAPASESDLPEISAGQTLETYEA